MAQVRRVGRPTKKDTDPEVRVQLLHVALGLFSEKGFADVSLREVAEQAHVTPAMVSYYFKSKVGLYESVLDSVIERLLPKIRETMALGFGSEESLESFVNIFASLMMAEPDLPKFMIREVILGDGRLRDRFIETYAIEVLALVPAKIVEEIKGGNFRKDLNPFLALLSLFGMMLFPFLARTIAESSIGLKFDDALKDELVGHTTKLFLHGVSQGEVQ
jgi:TetR/AcrR family transcriptional regulator